LRTIPLSLPAILRALRSPLKVQRQPEKNNADRKNYTGHGFTSLVTAFIGAFQNLFDGSLISGSARSANDVDQS
jgi:hypothetical protein